METDLRLIPGIQRSFRYISCYIVLSHDDSLNRAFSESQVPSRRANSPFFDQFGVFGSSKLPRRANTELRPKKLKREAGYGITVVGELNATK